MYSNTVPARKIDKFPEINYGEKIPVGGKSGRNCSATTDDRELLPPRFQRWESQRKKINRLAYRFSIDFKIYRLAYGFLCVNHKGLTKVFLIRAFFSRDFKNS
jgi:hypothetical protein